MSKIYGYGKFLIHVWPKDHLPVHCHVYVDEYEIKVFLPDYAFEVIGNKFPPIGLIKEVLELVKDSKNLIGKEWRRLHGN